MAVPYLNHGDSPDNERMDALFRDGLESKMIQILHGKSFYLASPELFRKREGQTFFFTSGPAVYAARCAGWVNIAFPDTRTSRPYDHGQFTDAVAGINLLSVTWDEVNKIADVPTFADVLFDGLTTGEDTSLLAYSLQAHFLMHQGASDVAPVPYYIRETKGGNRLTPERRHKFAVAEIIIEGQSNATIEQAWDKYCCFRVHNLQHTAATITFQNGTGGTADLIIPLAPLQCITIRRDSPVSNYRYGTYFWAFETGDPRFFMTIGKDGFDPDPYFPSNAVTNSQAVNNLTNPCILYDWVETLLTTDLAAFQRTQDIANIYPSYTSLFGDPANPTTIFGDLMHHRGEIMIVRSSKTLVEPLTSKPVLTFDTVQFNGYATIVADFAAHSLQVVEDGNGDYIITSVDAANNVYLVPISTNLFKKNWSREMVIDLSGSNSFTIENAIFEGSGSHTDGSLGVFEQPTQTPPQIIFHPSVIVIPDSRSYLTDPLINPFDETAIDGDDIIEQDWTSARPVALTLHGIHRYTVADVLSMSFWGDQVVPDQNSDYVAISNRSMSLTPEGIIIKYSHEKIHTEVFTDDDVFKARQSTIQFRDGSGWGYGAFSGFNAAFLSPLYDRYQVDDHIQNELAGVSGADFSFSNRPFNTVSANILTQLNATTSFILPDYEGFVFKFYNPGDYLIGFLKMKDELTASEFGEIFYNAAQSGNWRNYFGADPDQRELKMPLTHEMYNGLAQCINSITVGRPLSSSTLAVFAAGKILSFGAAKSFPGTDAPSTNGALSSWIEDGSWDADTNTPDISALAAEGHFWNISTAGNTNLSGIADWQLGQLAVFYEGAWHKFLSTDQRMDDWNHLGIAGPVPMDCVAMFEAGSEVHQVFEALGVSISDAGDFPGGPAGAFSTYAGFVTHRAVWYDRRTDPEDVDADGIIHSNSFSELLDTANLRAGLATGTDCFGTWDGDLGNMPALFTWYFDQPGGPEKWWSDAPEAGFYVISQDSKYVVQALPTLVIDNPGSGYTDGDVIFIDGGAGRPTQAIATVFAGAVTELRVSDPGWYDSPPAGNPTVSGGTGTGLTIFDHLSLTGLDHFRWVRISSIQDVLHSWGLPFFWREIIAPISLEYYDRAWEIVPGTATAEADITTNPGEPEHVSIEITREETFAQDETSIRFQAVTLENIADAQWKRITPFAFGNSPSGDIYYRLPWNGLSPIVRDRNFGSELEYIIQFQDSGANRYHSFLEFSSNQETWLTDQRLTMAAQIYLEGRTGVDEALLIGQRQWVKESDWWDTTDNLRTLAQFDYQGVPWVFNRAPANALIPLTDTPLNFLEAVPGETYRVFTSLADTPLIQLT